VRRLLVSEFVTVDGVMEAPGGEPSHPHTNWVSRTFGEEAQQRKAAELFETESLLLGRVTYESFAGAWPTYEGEMADKMNSMHKDVVSSTLRDPEWSNTAVLDGDIADSVRALKEGDGGQIMVNGSATLVRALFEHDLVDELRLMVFPISIGGGLRLFPESRTKTELQLTENRTFPNGIVELTYVTER
jgi:dihydrofolate reductase